MAQYGLQIKDPNTGLVILRITDRLTRVIGQIDTGVNNGSFALPTDSGGEPFFLSQPALVDATSVGPTVSRSGNTVVWSFPANAAASQRVSVTIIYGVW